MDNKFYDIKNVPFSDRESFNNAIILLTMVKSEYYYIVGFSRTKGIIKIGFDFESDYHEIITEIISIDFNSCDENVEISCKLQNFDSTNVIIEPNKYNGIFSVINNRVFYKKTILKDDIFPLSVKYLNENILIAKSDIVDFLERQYKIKIDYKKGKGDLNG